MPKSTRTRSDSPTKTCTRVDCDRPLRARGLCVAHYNDEHYSAEKLRHRKYLRQCAICDVEWQAARSRAKYCSNLCKAFAYSVRMSCPVPWTHPVWSTPIPLDHPVRLPSPQPTPLQLECEWCGQDSRHLRYCSMDCRRRAKRVRRKAREADGHTYSWSHVMQVLALLGGCCAYCDSLIDGPPDPDHVVPLSRQGSNGNGNILPVCRPCNSDKRDLLLHEWATDRARRGKPPVRTLIDRRSPAFAHLLPDAVSSSVTPANCVA